MSRYTDVKRVCQGLEEWSYGKGDEGHREPPGSRKRINVVVVDGEFPWWFSPARSVDFNVTNVWLSNYTDVSRFQIGKEWCKGALVESAAEPTGSFIAGMFRSEVVLINGPVPSALEKKGLWTIKTGSNIKLIAFTEGSKHKPRHPWRCSDVTVDHGEIGGVTNGKYRVNFHLLSPTEISELKLSEKTYVRQDLRWILKSKEVGKLVAAPNRVVSTEATVGVHWDGNELLSEASLLPFNKRNTLVLTRFRHDQWVVRKLSNFELLLTMDVPEQLIRTLASEEDQLWLLNSIKTPSKVLQRVVEQIAKVVRSVEKQELISSPNDKRRKQREWISDTSVEKRLKVTSEKLEWVKGFQTLDTIWEVNNQRSSEKGNVKFASTIPKEVVEERVEDDADAVATKGDDAQVRIKLWDTMLRKGLHPIVQARNLDHAIYVLRKYLLIVWKRKVISSYKRWEQNEEREGRGLTIEDQRDGQECCDRAEAATWWNWDGGSRPFFWRWESAYQSIVRNGVPIWFDGTVKKWTQRQREPRNKQTRLLMREKLKVVRTKGYVETGRIDSLMSFFDVPKGKHDIRMVYDGTKSGLNESLWTPWFPLPTAECLVRSLEPGFSMADNDVGEMFHNFILHKELRRYCGLDMTLFFPEQLQNSQKKNQLWERWTRLAMGLRNSPYNAVQGMMIAKEMILGKNEDNNNVFRWESVRLNLPGSQGYDPAKSWIAKVRSDGIVAADVFIYVDDIRTSAPTNHEAWQAAQRTSSILGYLGIQDAARKRRQPGQEAGAWTGSVVWTSHDTVVVLTTQEKWNKTKDHIGWIAGQMMQPGGLNLKTMLSIRGFLVYVARTYPSMVPYLKGIHATIDSWRPGRNGDGWKYPGKRNSWTDELDAIDYDARFGLVDEEMTKPEYLRPVPRLAGDIKCLMDLTSSASPPPRRVRMGKQGRVMYGFGDASKQGFGASVELDDQSVMWRSGEFTTIVKEQSSNYRELLNLVEYIESIYAKGLLEGCELFMFTDNSTAEAAYFKGTSSSEHLFNLVLRLRKIEMSGTCILHMIHVAGTRMIWQGTDGLSRGDKNAGVMAGESMLSFLPLHRSAVERSGKLLEWLKSWGCSRTESEPPLVILEVADWYKSLRDTATYVWFPPPAIADVAAELMAQAIHKRPYSTHVFVCPRLMTARWMRLILKATDATWKIPVGTELWEKSNHEPLVVSIYFPLSRSKPWRHVNTPQLCHETKLVQALLDSGSPESGIMLRQLLLRTRSMAGV